MTRVWLLAWALLALAGCSGGADQLVDTWRLRTASGYVDLTLPVHLGARIQASDPAYVLDADVSLRADLRGVPLVFSVPLLQGETELTVDGVAATPLDDDRAHGYRVPVPQSFAIPEAAAGRDTLHLALRVQHDWAVAGWLDTVPRLYPASRWDPAVVFVALMNGPIALFSCAGAWVFALLYFAMYARDRTRRTNLWFGIGAFAAGYYGLYQTGITEHVFGAYDLHLASLCIGVGSIAEVYYTHALVGLPRPSGAWLVALAFAVVVPGAPWSRDAEPRWLLVGIVVTTVAAAYQLVLLARFPRAAPGAGTARLLLLAWLPLLPAFVVDSIAFAGLGEVADGARVAPVALFVFTFFQSTLIGREHAAAGRRAQALGTDLHQRVVDLEESAEAIRSLERSLRVQIADRSKQLIAALRVLEAGGEPSIAATDLRRSLPTPRDVWSALAQVAQALADLHGSGRAHGGVSAAAIRVAREDGRLVASLAAGEDPEPTRARVEEPPSAASPESTESSTVTTRDLADEPTRTRDAVSPDAAADVRALAVVALSLLDTGESPAPLEGLPADVAALLRRCLEGGGSGTPSASELGVAFRGHEEDTTGATRRLATA